jgi:predicted lipid-binding transport protein (Tim44 family)
VPATPDRDAARSRAVARGEAEARADRQARREAGVVFEEGWFGSVNSGMVGGLLMMGIAVLWFFAGLAGGVIFIYPPVLFVIGVVSLLKGLFSRE